MKVATQKALTFKCQNPACKQPWKAKPVYNIDQDWSCDPPAFYACNECMEIKHGPYELFDWCRKCNKHNINCDCHSRQEFIYGGPLVYCEQCHKMVVLVDGGNGIGFAGGRVYWDRYSCGHMEVDESDDLAAAI